MRIGSLNKLVTIQKPTQASDSMGGFTVTWTDQDTAWAAIWPVSANEQVRAGQVSGEITHRIRLRYRADILASWRIKYGDRYFSITGPPVNPEMRNRWLDLVCKEAT